MLKHLCAPDVGEDNGDEGSWENLPKMWTNHLEDAMWALNNRVLPALKHTPKELLLGLVINTKCTRPEDSMAAFDVVQASAHMAYAAQQWLDGYDEAVRHASKWKRAFDQRILSKQLGEVIFEKGQLVQIYRSDTDYTFKTDQKLIPKWLVPHRVTKWLWNAYKLEMLQGMKLTGEFSVRCL
ncbi:hypothetical protein PISMIDRAFT_121989 [Pisolithus microcarpus 441]|uniref:Uncharacterized protein n=1 Tax=Pisolithus microcarpus 441 TaxID=765257 RepID=A0A0C9YDG1_9AGAM|nr:hypothetical protein PISMIDRAFT_121989 [Pisolithus microcarpus 441]